MKKSFIYSVGYFLLAAMRRMPTGAALLGMSYMRQKALHEMFVQQYEDDLP